jgi:predicted transcriptional regulator
LLKKGSNDRDVRETPLKLTKREREILSVVRDNPEGITLPETAYILDTASVMISKHMKKLLSLGLIKKIKNRYFLDKMDE